MKSHFNYSPLMLVLISLWGCSQSTSDAKAPVSEPKAAVDLNKNGQLEPYENSALPLDERLNDLLARLTPAEKVQLVTGTGINLNDIGGSSKVHGAAGSTHAIARLGIPAITLADGPAGLRITPIRQDDQKTYYATAFPIATVLSSSWDKSLVNQVGQAMGTEVKEYGVDLFLAPGMNLQYNPLGGRNFEYYAEDPLLSGQMAAAMVNGVESQGVGATIKHFAVNNAETSRMLLNSVVNERALREIYLRSFEIAVKEAQPWAVMSSYNKINGVYTSQDPQLLTSLLRDEWGFDGLVMTDWFGGDSARAQMKAGNDLIMPGRPHERDDIQAALDSGDLSMAQLDKNVKNILQTIFQSPTFAGYAYSDTPDLKAHARIARTAAAEGVVLLKNDNETLPLPSSVKSIAAFGNTSYDFISGGTGSGDVNEAYTVSLVQGFANNNLQVDAELQQVYQQHLQAERAKQPKKRYFFELLPPLPELTPDLALIQRKAKDTELAVITIGRNSGEFQDRKVAGDFDLTATEKQLISMVSAAFHAEGKKVVLILNIGNVVETASWREQVDAIVLPWQGGQEAGNAVTDVLTGKVNPSGKLPVSFPLHYNDVPSSAFFPGEALSDEVVMDAYLNMPRGKHSQMKHQDGIYVGYRYYDSFAVPVAYPFGYGLSYTSFSYGQPQLSSASFNGELTISLEVKNTGKVAGKEVVQLYLTAPATSMDKPKKELKAFAKTNVLAPGQSETLQFSLTADQLASYSEQAGRWVADAGTYQVLVAASSADVRQTASFNLATALQLPAVKVRLQPTTALTEFKPPVR